MSIKAWGSVGVLCGVVAVVVTACGDDTTVSSAEPCVPKAVECLDDPNHKLARACPNDDEPSWVNFSCGENEICEAGTCKLDESKSGLLGLCKAGDKECVSDALARQCALGGDAWVPLACQRGTVCNDGDCVPAANNGDASPGVQVCTPKAVACATDHAVKTCQNDGSDWVITPCSDNEKCDSGACVVDEDQSCTPGTSSCTSSSGGYRCAADGSHNEPFGCPPEAPCTGFKCAGTVCTPGETKCADPGELFQTHSYNAPQIFASNQMFQCNDSGSAWELVPCPADEYCKYDSLTAVQAQGDQDRYLSWYNQQGTKPTLLLPPDVFTQASCVKPECYDSQGPTGESVCGDPMNPSTTKSDSYSQCEGLLPFTVPHWVPYLCNAPTMCDPSQEGAATCNSDCTPGESVCATALGGDGDGIMVCNADGEWEPATDCNSGGDKAQACYTQYPEHGGSREAKCVDPVCAYIWTNYNDYSTEFGVCAGDQVRLCNADGQVVAAEQASDCEKGVCDDWTTIENNAVGRCQSQCSDGDSMCLDADIAAENQYGGALASSPFYLQCQGGTWSLEVHSCAGDALCFGIKGTGPDSSGGTTICGGQCVPGWRQCATDSGTGASGVATCNAQGTWDAQVDCAVGSCVAENQGPDSNGFSSLDAECRFACVPGHYQCGFDQDLGSYTSAQCSTAGKFGESQTCPTANDLCDVNVGCYECVGQNLAAMHGTTVDTQCAVDGSILTCGTNNRWPVQGTSCGTGMVCGETFGRAHCVGVGTSSDAGAPNGNNDAGVVGDAATSATDAAADAN